MSGIHSHLFRRARRAHLPEGSAPGGRAAVRGTLLITGWRTKGYGQGFQGCHLHLFLHARCAHLPQSRARGGRAAMRAVAGLGVGPGAGCGDNCVHAGHLLVKMLPCEVCFDAFHTWVIAHMLSGGDALACMLSLTSECYAYMLR